MGNDAIVLGNLRGERLMSVISDRVYSDPRTFLAEHPLPQTDEVIKVLWIHGLEGGPDGSKARSLKDDPRFTVRALQMNTKNLFTSTLLQLEEMKSHPPDLIAGSSYGGMIAMLLIQMGLWQGPTLLLAPATGLLFPSRLHLPAEAKALIVHGESDEDVPYEHSLRIVRAAPKAQLVTIPDGSHRLQELVTAEPGSLRDLAEATFRLYGESRQTEPSRISWWDRLKVLFTLTAATLRNLPTVISALRKYKK